MKHPLLLSRVKAAQEDTLGDIFFPLSVQRNLFSHAVLEAPAPAGHSQPPTHSATGSETHQAKHVVHRPAPLHHSRLSEISDSSRVDWMNTAHNRKSFHVADNKHVAAGSVWVSWGQKEGKEEAQSSTWTVYSVKLSAVCFSSFNVYGGWRLKDDDSYRNSQLERSEDLGVVSSGILRHARQASKSSSLKTHYQMLGQIKTKIQRRKLLQHEVTSALFKKRVWT